MTRRSPLSRVAVDVNMNMSDSAYVIPIISMGMQGRGRRASLVKTFGVLGITRNCPGAPSLDSE